MSERKHIKEMNLPVKCSPIFLVYCVTIIYSRLRVLGAGAIVKMHAKYSRFIHSYDTVTDICSAREVLLICRKLVSKD